MNRQKVSQLMHVIQITCSAGVIAHSAYTQTVIPSVVAAMAIMMAAFSLLNFVTPEPAEKDANDAA